MNRRSFLAAASAIPLATVAPGDLPPTVVSPLSIYTTGDSITNGYGDSRYGTDAPITQVGYRRELGRQLTHAGIPYTMANGAQGGGTTADLLKWLPAEVATKKPDLVVLAIGTNDAVQSNASLAAFESNYAALLAAVFNAYPPVKICASLIGYSATDWFRPNEKKVNDAIFRQAWPGVGPHGTRICGVADFQYLHQYGLVDGVHPNDAGYDIMGGIVFRAISSWLGVS